jgi:hypothetical protein
VSVALTQRLGVNLRYTNMVRSMGPPVLVELVKPRTTSLIDVFVALSDGKNAKNDPDAMNPNTVRFKYPLQGLPAWGFFLSAGEGALSKDKKA